VKHSILNDPVGTQFHARLSTRAEPVKEPVARKRLVPGCRTAARTTIRTALVGTK